MEFPTEIIVSCWCIYRGKEKLFCITGTNLKFILPLPKVRPFLNFRLSHPYTIKMLSEMKNYKTIAAEKKAQQWERIPKGWRIPGEEYEDEKNISMYTHLPSFTNFGSSHVLELRVQPALQPSRLLSPLNEKPNWLPSVDIPLTCGLLNKTETRITSDHDATALLEKLADGIWSVEEVTVAFCKRAAIAHQLVSPSYIKHLAARKIRYGLVLTCARRIA